MKNGWQIIAPQAATNQVFNPSGEIAGNFAAVGAATVTRETTYQKYGLYSYRVQTAANNQGIQLTLATLTNTTHYATVRVRGRTPAQWGFSLSASPYIPAIFLENLGEGWSLYGLEFGAAAANGKTFLRVGQLGPGSGDFYLDGVQVETGGDPTTYCDGTQEGCAWNGPAHAATSTRSAESRAGGLVKDFFDDYGFFVEKIVGAGAPTQTLSIDEYALLPGGELNSIKTNPRQMTIIGKFIGDSEKDLHDKRQALLSLLSDESYPENQPVKIRFSGGSVPKEIGVFYQRGLEGELDAFYCEFAPDGDNQWARLNKWIEKCAIQFNAPDPFWYEVGESAAALDTNDSATFRYVAARLKSTGQWNPLGPPGAATAITSIEAIVEDATYIYVGGTFTDFAGIANADFIVRYNKLIGVWSALGTGMAYPAHSPAVFGLALAPDGSLYAAGFFDTAGGVAAANIAKWDGSAWSALGTGLTGGASPQGDTMAIGPDGNLYVGGLFTTAGGVAAANIAKWDGAAFTALDVGVDSRVRAIAIGPDGTLYAGGYFANAGGAPAKLVAQWDGAAWSPMGTGFPFGASVEDIALAVNGLIYVVGVDVQPSVWNGAIWTTLGSGVDAQSYSMAIGLDGMVYVGGDFTTAGGITLTDRIARWNGYAWAHLDIDLPGTPFIGGILASKYVDPVIPQKYDLVLGFETAGTASYAGKVAVSNAGTEPAFPKVIFSRSGGTTAVVETLKNERTGKELLFNYSLLNGETLTVDLAPTKKSIVSSFFGARLNAVLANSDFGDWRLLPGSNDVTSFVGVSGAPTVTANLLWRDRYRSWD